MRAHVRQFFNKIFAVGKQGILESQRTRRPGGPVKILREKHAFGAPSVIVDAKAFRASLCVWLLDQEKNRLSDFLF